MVSLTVSDARRRGRIVAVDRSLLDLARGPGTFGSTTTVRFRRVGPEDTSVADRTHDLRRVVGMRRRYPSPGRRGG